MPALLPQTSRETDFLDVAVEWLNLISAGNFKGAYLLTLHDPYYRWTPELIESTVKGYGLPEPHPSGHTYMPTPPNTARGEPLDRTVELFPKPITAGFTPSEVIGEVCHAIPLDGEWSDLTVTFALIRSSQGIFLGLKEIHVF